MYNPDFSRCSSGSRQDYRHCVACEAYWANHSELEWERPAHVASLFDALQAFVDSHFDEIAIHEAWEDFTAEFAEEDDAVLTFSENFRHAPLFFPYFFHHWRVDPDREYLCKAEMREQPPTHLYMARHGWKLEEFAKRYLEACVTTPYSFYEILEVRGDGLKVRDLISDIELLAFTKTVPTTLAIGNVLYALIVRVDSLAYIEAGPPVPLPASSKAHVSAMRNHFAAQHAARGLEFAEQIAWDLRELYFDRVEALLDPPLPYDAFVSDNGGRPQRLVYKILSVTSAFNALAPLADGLSRLEDLHEPRMYSDGELCAGYFDWVKDPDSREMKPKTQPFGNIEIQPSFLICRVKSARRAAQLRRYIDDSPLSTAQLLDVAYVDEFDTPMEAFDERWGSTVRPASSNQVSSSPQ